MHKLLHCGALLVLFMGTGFLTSCHSNANPQTDTIEDTVMVIDTNADAPKVDEGLTEENQIEIPEMVTVPLTRFPTTDPHLSVTLSEDHSRADISYDGEVIQTVVDEEDGLVSVGDHAPVRYLDANFDGYTDIFIGAGESRTYSSLLIWDAQTQRFNRIGTLGEPSLQGFMLDPGSESIIEGGSDSYCEFSITRSQWKNGILTMENMLTIITEPKEYIINGVEHRYTLRDVEGHVLCSVEDREALPGPWPRIANEYGY